jgi:hypothetical protein
MKRRIMKLALLTAIVVSLGSCIKNDPILFKESVAEFDATVLNTPATGATYPLLVRVPVFGFAVAAANPAITRASGAIGFRINLASAQFDTDQVLNISVVTDKTTAIAGTHYTIPAKVTIPAKSSYGTLTVTVVNPGVSSLTPVDLVVQIDGNDQVKPSENYKRLGIRIAQN